MMQHEIDAKTFTIAFQRELSASLDEVFDAWTRPEQVAQWWDPTGEPLVTCEIDLRPGGAFRFVNKGHSAPFAGSYVVIDRPARLVFEALGSVGTVMLKSAGDTTRMHVIIRCASKEHFDRFVQMGIAPNTDRTLDNLVRYLASHAARKAH